jgi:hypothetical protein
MKLEVTSWPEWRSFSTLSDDYEAELEFVDGFSSIDPPPDYKLIWKDVSMAVQIKKARNHGLTKEETFQCFHSLVKRPYFLCQLATKFGCKNFAEIGTAQGLQFFSFAEQVKGTKGHVWSCDIQDVRNYEYTQRYKENTSFYLGDSGNLAAQILNKGEKIDFFYIDGAHQKGSVDKDVENLREVQSETPVWVFDDFDERFGCYEDIKKLCLKNTNFVVYRVGNAASGNPNHQVVILGKL